MEIIAAYPCLGKTTLYKLNKDIIFDREFKKPGGNSRLLVTEMKAVFISNL